MNCNESAIGIFHLLLNYVASVSVVIVNKMLYQFYGFQNSNLLTISHFAFTGIGLMISYWMGLISLVKVNFKSLIPLIIVYALSVPLCSLSICANTLGFYQVRLNIKNYRNNSNAI